jgi:hypothetical protein
MTDHCQKKVVKEQGIDFGPGLCEKKNEQTNSKNRRENQ